MLKRLLIWTAHEVLFEDRQREVSEKIRLDSYWQGVEQNAFNFWVYVT